MEAWLEDTLIIMALALSIASIASTLWLYTSIRRGFMEAIRKDIMYGKPRRSRNIKRYLVFRIYRVKGEAGFENIDACFKNAVTEHLGILENSERGLKLIRYNAQSGVGVVRIVSSDVYKVIFAISRLRRCGDSVVIVMPILITGTLKKAVVRAHEYESKYR